jgi:purine catabolism regulator
VIHESDSLRSPDHHAIDRTAEAVAISVLSAREVSAQEAQREGALVSRLLLGDISGDAFVARALRLGKDLRGRSLLAICAVKDGDSDTLRRERLTAASQAVSLPALVADVGEDVVAIAGLRRPQDEHDAATHLTLQGLRAGISRPTTPQDLSAAIRQAKSAASVAASRLDRQVVRFDDLGILRLLVSLSQGPELANYVEDELGAILRHDADSRHPLLPTLRAYLANDANKSQTAAQLFIQRRTLYYRLERIDALLGRSLEDSEVRQNLLFALHGRDLLRQGGAQSAQ